MTTIITYGTFDLFHVGHVRLFQRLKSLGDKVVVGCSTDEFNRLKGKSTIIPYEQRVEVLLACRHVDGVFPENNWEQKRDDILREGASIFAMGDDWAGKFDDLSDIVKVIYLPRTLGISTTEVRQIVNSMFEERITELRKAYDQLGIHVKTL
jgi:glycerol-3-phosphate cytidylyltransferase